MTGLRLLLAGAIVCGGIETIGLTQSYCRRAGRDPAG